MIRFILNDREVETALPPGMLVLDYVRYQKHLTGTKIGCREGDCGACTVLIGELVENQLVYKTATSCLTPLGNVENKHVVTIEGLNLEELNPIQQAMVDEAGTQCGFCTPGFIVSMAGYCLSDTEPTTANAKAAVDGNICRCTGYKSIERALGRINAILQRRQDQSAMAFVTENRILPAYFAGIEEQLKAMQVSGNKSEPSLGAKFVGGGTDLYVQQHEAMVHANIDFLGQAGLKGIRQKDSMCVIGSATTVTELLDSELIQQNFPQIRKFVKLVSSTPIRNIATLGGNFVNASPIGDFSVFFLALDARLILSNSITEREIPLRDFYKGYKQLNKLAEEFIKEIHFELPSTASFFNFEKVSKRTHLDIASVNTAISITLSGEVIAQASISAGGVAPVPMFLKQTSAFLEGKVLSEELVLDATEVLQKEISPISDARGTEEYKRLLLSQLVKSHFLTLFPQLQVTKLIG